MLTYDQIRAARRRARNAELSDVTSVLGMTQRNYLDWRESDDPRLAYLRDTQTFWAPPERDWAWMERRRRELREESERQLARERQRVARARERAKIRVSGANATAPEPMPFFLRDDLPAVNPDEMPARPVAGEGSLPELVSGPAKLEPAAALLTRVTASVPEPTSDARDALYLPGLEPVSQSVPSSAKRRRGGR